MPDWLWPTINAVVAIAGLGIAIWARTVQVIERRERLRKELPKAEAFLEMRASDGWRMMRVRFWNVSERFEVFKVEARGVRNVIIAGSQPRAPGAPLAPDESAAGREISVHWEVGLPRSEGRAAAQGFMFCKSKTSTEEVPEFAIRLSAREMVSKRVEFFIDAHVSTTIPRL